MRCHGEVIPVVRRGRRRARPLVAAALLAAAGVGPGAAPPLAGLAGRAYIAGVLPNTPDNLIRWIQNPPGIDEKTAMPNVGVTARDARNIAAYLYTLK